MAQIQAKKVKDEPSMVAGEAEAMFWGSVGSWIEAAGVARMKSEPLPEWLAKLDVQWNP
jgi:hypothetical protein